MKKLIIFFVLIVLSNLISAQSDSVPVYLLSDCKPISEYDFVFKKNCIYGEYHNYDMTDQIAEVLFEKFCIKNKNKIKYYIEGSSVHEYVFYRYRKNYNYLNYNQQKIPFEDIGGLTSLLSMYSKYKSDTNIVFKSLDCERAYMASFLCLKDILFEYKDINSFNYENDLLNKSLNKSNKKLLKKAKLLAQDFRNDTLKFFEKLSFDNYTFYKNIIIDLENGIIYNKMEKDKSTYTQSYFFRESIMYNKIISQLKTNTSFFLHVGLFHALDSMPNFYNKVPWVSVAERLSKKLGYENITKICLLKLTRESNFVDDLIIEKDLLKELSDEQFASPCPANLKKFSYIKTKFDYGILFK